MALIARVIGIVVGGILLGFHGFAIYMSVKLPKVKKTRFICLALLLSLSDFIYGMEVIYLLSLKILNDGSKAYEYQCMLCTNLVSGTVITSLYQTLLICFERMNATFLTNKRTLKTLTRNTSVILVSGIIHCFAIIRFGIETINMDDSACGIKYPAAPIFLFTHDIPAVLLITAIILCYGVVIRRMLKQNTVFTTMTNTQNAVQEKASQSMKKNMVTLGLIIGVAVISALPRTLIGIHSYVSGDDVIVNKLSPIANTVFLAINPLADPVIYVFRIKQYRDQLKCKCLSKNNAVSDEPTGIAYQTN